MPKTQDISSPLVIVGEEDIVLGFKALGFKVYPVKNEGNWGAILEEIIEGQTAVCLLQDNFYKSAETQLAAYRKLAIPVFIPFGKDGGMSILAEMVKDIRIKATGAY